MIIGIVAAMDIEINKIKDSFEECEKNIIAGVKFFASDVNGNKVILVKGGVGKVAIAHATSLLCNLYKPNVVINTGIAGGLDPLKTGDVVLANQLIYHDVDAVGFGYELGEVPGMPKMYEVDKTYQEKVKMILAELNIEYKTGTILTGDMFVTSREMLRLKHNDGYVATDMEGASIAQICFLFQTPFVSIRFISDSIDSPNQQLEYNAFEEEAAGKSAEICVKVINNFN